MSAWRRFIIWLNGAELCARCKLTGPEASQTECMCEFRWDYERERVRKHVLGSAA